MGDIFDAGAAYEIPASQPAAPEPQQSLESPQGGAESAEAQSPQVVDLDKMERFRFEGRELTPRELKQSFLRHGDYTRKTQEIARERAQMQEARKYADNFAADLEFVLGDPENRLAKMRGVYPQEYVKLAEQAISRLGASRASGNVDPSQSMTSQLPPEMRTALDEIKDWKTQVQEQTVQATLSQLDALHESLGKKYPWAVPEVVDTRIAIAIEKGLQVDRNKPGELAALYEKAYKYNNDEISQRVQTSQKSKVEEQLKAGKRSRDTAPGGSTPGLAPKKYKKLDDVERDLFSRFK